MNFFNDYSRVIESPTISFFSIKACEIEPIEDLTEENVISRNMNKFVTNTNFASCGSISFATTGCSVDWRKD